MRAQGATSALTQRPIKPSITSDCKLICCKGICIKVLSCYNYSVYVSLFQHKHHSRMKRLFFNSLNTPYSAKCLR